MANAKEIFSAYALNPIFFKNDVLAKFQDNRDKTKNDELKLG